MAIPSAIPIAAVERDLRYLTAGLLPLRMKAVVGANRCAASMDALAQQAIARLAAFSPGGRLHRSGLLGETLQWLATEGGGRVVVDGSWRMTCQSRRWAARGGAPADGTGDG